MADRIELEGAIMDAEGAVAVLSILEEALMTSTQEGWLKLGLSPREDLCVTALTPTERQALDYASTRVCVTVKEVARVFYAALEERRL